MQNAVSLWRTFDNQRRLVIAGAVITSLVLILVLARIASAPGMSLLYAGLENAAAGEVISNLEVRNVAYEVRGDAIFVPTAMRDELRLMLAAQGLPASAHVGYEILDSLSGFGTTSQMFDAAYWRAKEGELARTIVSSPHVRAARVHISQANMGVFRRDTAPSASVTVSTSGAFLTPDQARAIRFLVAAAVSGLSPENVSVIDSAGGMVYAPDDEGRSAMQTASQALDLQRKVERLLEAHVGRGRAVVEVSIEPVTEREVIRERRIDPESRVAISTEVEENILDSTDTRAQGVTVASNLPDGDAVAGDGSARNRENQNRERTSFDVSEIQREIERIPGSIRRMTVAVLIDGVVETAADGTTAWRARSAEELEALRELVSSAVGLDLARADVVTLRSLRFEPLPILGTEAQSGMFANTTIDVMTLIKLVFALAALLILALFVLRPLLLSARKNLEPKFVDAEKQLLTSEILDRTRAIPSLEDASKEPQAPDPVERLRRLIEARGDDSVEVLKHWMDDGSRAR
ncbi:MAG: flagellar basal-body MS-ring/collar protein FliF [Roseinatronobacter sp.]